MTEKRTVTNDSCTPSDTSFPVKHAIKMSGKQSETVRDQSTPSQLWGCDCKYKCIHEENYQRIVKELLDLVDNDENQTSSTNSNKSNSANISFNNCNNPSTSMPVVNNNQISHARTDTEKIMNECVMRLFEINMAINSESNL